MNKFIARILTYPDIKKLNIGHSLKFIINNDVTVNLNLAALATKHNMSHDALTGVFLLFLSERGHIMINRIDSKNSLDLSQSFIDLSELINAKELDLKKKVFLEIFFGAVLIYLLAICISNLIINAL